MSKPDLKSSNFAGSALSVSDEKETESESESRSKSAAASTAMSASAAMSLDNQYIKTSTKKKVKFIKLNFDNYQSWSDGMKFFFDAKTLWFLIDGIEKIFDFKIKSVDHKAWKFDDNQIRMWIYVNVENVQHNHIKRCNTAQKMWEALKKMHGALNQNRLNFLKKKFFNYKTESSESIDDVSSELFRMQMIIKNIKFFEISTNLNIAFILINFIDHETYTMAKYHLEDMEDLTLTHIKERLKLVKQRIKNETVGLNSGGAHRLDYLGSVIGSV